MAVDREPAVAVLMSGGLDSAVLAVDLLRDHARVFPLYIRGGLKWEEMELAAVREFLAAVPAPGLEVLTVLEEPLRDIYGPHWSTGADDVADAGTPDEAVYLPGQTSCSRSRRRSGAGSGMLVPSPWGAWAPTPFPIALPVSSMIWSRS